MCLPIGDLVQEGNIGLMQARRPLRPRPQWRFSTYGPRGGFGHRCRNFQPSRLRAKFLDGGGAGLLDEKGRAKVAHTLKVPDPMLRAWTCELLAHDFSLNAPVAEDNDSEWQDFPADEGPGPEDIVTGAHDAQTQSQWIRTAMADLTVREQTIIRERRLSETGKTLETLGGELGISKERVRQIEQEAMAKRRISIAEFAGDAVKSGSGGWSVFQ